MNNMIDIYFNEKWLGMFAERDGNPLETFRFESENGTVEYTFSKRKICIDGVEYPYYDIVTPYAFSGPAFYPAYPTDECQRKLAREFNSSFESYCKENSIVAEFVQFNPWVGNSRFLEDFYEMDFRSAIYGIDLTKDVLMEMDGKRRAKVRKALKAGFELVYDYQGEYVEEFLKLYNYTVDKYDVTDYYRFDEEFVRRLFRDLNGHVFLILAKYQGEVVNSSLNLMCGDYVHGFLAGNKPEARNLNGNSLTVYDMAKTMKEKGYKLLIMGGGDGNLLSFKKSFSKDTVFDYYSGKKIHMQDKYDEFTRINGVLDTKFFPAYRDNGKVKYKHWEADEEQSPEEKTE